MTTFQVRISGTWTTPPVDARPASIGSPNMPGAPIVRFYEPEGRDGNGRPVATSSEMWAIVGRTHINTTGLAWWFTTAGLGTSVSKQIDVRLFNPFTQSWVAYTGLAWRPTYSGGRAGNRVTDFMVKITNLEAI